MRNILLVILTCAAISCDSEKRETLIVIDTQAERPSPQFLSQIFEKSEIVRLEINDSFLIRDVRHLAKAEQYIFIAEYNRVSQWDIKGRFIRQIGSFGRGPGQYRSIRAIAVNSINNKLIIATYHHLLCYDFNGRFIKSIPILRGTIDFVYFLDGHLWVYNKQFIIPTGDNSHMDLGIFYKYDDKLQIIDSMAKSQNKNNWRVFIGGIPTYCFSSLKSELYMYSPVLVPEAVLRDTFYVIRNSEKIPIMKLDFSKILSTDDNVKIDSKTMTPQAVREAEYRIRSVTISNIYRTNQFVFTEYSYLGRPFVFYYDLLLKKGYNIPEGFTDNLYGIGKPVQLLPLDLQYGDFCFIKNGYEVEGIVDGVGENSNPVIFFVKTKE